MNKITLSEKEVARMLLDFEKKSEVFSFTAGGISVWQLIRLPVATNLQRLSLSKTPLPRLSILMLS